MKFTKDHLIKAAPGCEYKEGNKLTILGWIIDIYLYPELENGYFELSDTNRKKYNKAIGVLRQLAGLKPKDNLFDWEETISETQAASLLNKLAKEMKGEN